MTRPRNPLIVGALGAALGLAVIAGCSIGERPWGPVPLPYGDASSLCPAATAPDVDKIEPALRPIVEMIHAVYWEGRCDAPAFRGRRSFSEEPLLSLPVAVEVQGLAQHPDGRVALSEGNGSTSEGLRLAFWTASGPGELVAALTQSSAATGASRAEGERRGQFWFFAGPLAFDRRGRALFSLGQTAPNGIYRVRSRQPLRVEQLYELRRGTSMLQIPPFDPDHAYVENADRILRYSLLRPEAPVPVFGLPQVLLRNTVLLGPSEAVVQVSEGPVPPRLNRPSASATLYFDGKARAFWALSEGQLGRMTLAWDGGLVRYDEGSHSLRRVRIEGR